MELESSGTPCSQRSDRHPYPGANAGIRDSLDPHHRHWYGYERSAVYCRPVRPAQAAAIPGTRAIDPAI